MGKHSRLRKIKTVGEGSVFDKDKKLNVDVLKQRVPKKFTEMMELKELCKSGSVRSVRKKLNGRRGGAEKKNVKESQRKPHESHRSHMERLASEVDASIKHARTSVQEFPEKTTETGGKKPVEKLAKKQRLEKMKRRQETVKNKRKEKLREKERWTDRVEFGEVVMEPPKLSSKPRKAVETKKPGQKDFLFLKTNPAFSKKSGISLAKTQILLDERQRVIDAYREMKKNKVSAKPA